MAHKLKKRPTDIYGQLPIYFIPNKGQLEDKRIHYYAKGAGCEVFFTNEGASFVFRKEASSSIKGKRIRRNKKKNKEKGFRLDFRFLGANQGVKPETREELSGKVNYFRAKNPEKGHTNISVFQEVIYREIWPGIDLLFRSEQGQIKYEFVLQPGAKVEDIRFTYEGAKKLSLDEEGNLLIDTPFEVIIDTLPVSYHTKNGDTHNVESAFQLISGDRKETIVTFTTGQGYDGRYPLIIDPGLVYSTYLGGSGQELGTNIAVDSAGNAYVIGVTHSTNFPITTGAFQTANNGGEDVFVTKLNPTGTALVYSTYLGGTNLDQGLDIAVDNTGNAYITGTTLSTNFPTTKDAFQTSLKGGQDIFVTKLNSTGPALIYSTYLGGSNTDYAFGIAVDNDGNAYVKGLTLSADFPTTAGAFQTSLQGTLNTFVTKLNSTGTALVYSTYLGEAIPTAIIGISAGIAVDNGGNAYITGTTQSIHFPTTTGAFQASLQGGQSAFVTKLNASGTALIYSTYLGGEGLDEGSDIAVDTDGYAYISGQSQSTNFPTTMGAFQTSLKGIQNAFVTKLNPTGTALVYSTYLGGEDADWGLSITISNTGYAYITGTTTSNSFPTTPDAFQATYDGNFDAYMAKLNPMGTALVYSTYLGGSNIDYGLGIAVDTQGNTYITGLTYSTNFPVTPDAVGTMSNGSSEAFITKFNAPPRIPLHLELGLTKDIQVQSDVTINVQGNFCKPRTTRPTNQETTDLSPQKEDHVGCIRATRVHDWVIVCTDHQQKEFIPDDCAQLILDCRTAGDNVTVRCEAVPGSSNFTVIDNTKLAHEFPNAHLVMIRFTVLVHLQYFCNGTPLCDFEVPITTVDKVVLCYPKGTSIVGKISTMDCSVVGEGC